MSGPMSHTVGHDRGRAYLVWLAPQFQSRKRNGCRAPWPAPPLERPPQGQRRLSHVAMIHEDSAGSRMGQGTGPWVPDGVGLGGKAEAAQKSAGHRWAPRSWGHCEGAGLESTINLIYKIMAAFLNGSTDWQVCSWLAVSRRTVGVESPPSSPAGKCRSPSYEGLWLLTTGFEPCTRGF